MFGGTELDTGVILDWGINPSVFGAGGDEMNSGGKEYECKGDCRKVPKGERV